MRARAVAGLALLALLGGALWWLAQRSAAAEAGGAAGVTAEAVAGTGGASAGGALAALGGPATCLPCHAAVVAEWQESMHCRAFTDPQVRAPDQSDNFQKQECLPCHASRPIFEHGIEKDSRVLARVERRVDGIDCLSCHGLPEGVAASRSGLVAACRPALRPELSTQQMCAACHNQHNTHDEWRASPAATAGKDCMECHMARVLRAGGEAGAPRGGRSHRFPGGRDRDFALAGLSVTAQRSADGGSLHVSLANEFAGHNLPTDSRNRALDLVVTLLDARGVPLPPPAGEKREPGCETGTARLRYRNPYRASGDPSTQLPAGQSSVLDVPVPAGAASATVELFYKLSPWVPDAEAHWTQRQELPLR
ncbi:MAG TPA: multiheme c-type cytochrome [Planctomycetota bacterium]|nr:multiheme c-type cytochrome [Planctomycetota bacterium]